MAQPTVCDLRRADDNVPFLVLDCGQRPQELGLGFAPGRPERADSLEGLLGVGRGKVALDLLRLGLLLLAYRLAPFQLLPLLAVLPKLGGLPVACGAVGIAGGALRVVVPVAPLVLLPGGRGALADSALDGGLIVAGNCLLYTSPSPRDKRQSRMPSSA